LTALVFFDVRERVGIDRWARLEQCVRQRRATVVAERADRGVYSGPVGRLRATAAVESRLCPSRPAGRRNRMVHSVRPGTLAAH
jgi:hypothetical protein